MRIVNGYRDLKEYNFTSSSSPEAVRYVSREVNGGSLGRVRNFDDSHGLNYVFNNLDNKWRMLLEVLNYNTEGKRVLDLGCGAVSGNMESVKHRGFYEPWFGRFIHSTMDRTGLEYVGVDCADSSKESFDFRKMNLLDEECLVNEFGENYFDVATAFMLFNSPELGRIIHGRYFPNASIEDSRLLASSILPQLEKVVKPDGVFLWHGSDQNFSI